jgi:hypothetical protein
MIKTYFQKIFMNKIIGSAYPCQPLFSGEFLLFCSHFPLLLSGFFSTLLRAKCLHIISGVRKSALNELDDKTSALVKQEVQQTKEL